MSPYSFSYEDFDTTRNQLMKLVQEGLEEKNREFLLNLNQMAPGWSIYDFSHYPSVKWKLINLEKFKKSRPEDYQANLEALKLQLN